MSKYLLFLSFFDIRYNLKHYARNAFFVLNLNLKLFEHHFDFNSYSKRFA